MEFVSETLLLHFKPTANCTFLLCLYDGMITHPEESYWAWRVCEWPRNLASSKALPHWGCGTGRKGMHIVKDRSQKDIIK